jgi:hypothetical protein
MKFSFLTLCAITMLAFTGAPASAQSYSVNWYKIAGGGGTSTGGTFSVSGTIGQPDASLTMTGGGFSLTITHSGPNVTVSWPDTGAFNLQQNTILQSGGWVNSGYTVSLANGTNSVTFTPTSGQLFFRLQQ